MTVAATRTIEVFDPASGEAVGGVPCAGEREVDAAVRAARAAQAGWAATPAAERGGRLKAVAAALRERVDELAELQTRECGKPIGDSRGGVEAGIGAIEQYAELGPLHRGRSLQGAPLAHDAMIFEPRGVVAAILPWNDPVALVCQALAAALVTGNTVVLKPSERTPLCSARTAELFADQLGEDVVAIVHGDGEAGAALACHADVDVVMHTGSIATGLQIAEVCAARGAKALLELGGNDALVVDDGVDPAWAAEQAALGAFANAGQICTSVERIYVHEAVAEPFVEALVQLACSLRMGPGLDPRTELGPLVDERHREAVHGHVADALRRGASALCGGAPAGGPGCFYPATVLTGISDDMLVMREETFGPVAPVRVVASFDEALELANASRYGLAATVLTCSQEHAARACAQLRAGTVKVNAVFGGAPGGSPEPQRQSGSGHGYGPELLDELTYAKVVHLEPGVAR